MITTMDLLGAWVSIFLTICILSFLYQDNPIYKLAEHLFLGVSIAVSVIEQWYGTFKPNLVDRLIAIGDTRFALGETWADHLSYLGGFVLTWMPVIPLALIVLFFLKLSRKLEWLARIPIAFVVAVFAGLKLTGEANANLMAPLAASMQDLSKLSHEHGFFDIQADGAGVFSGLVLTIGLCATLLHFYFSAAHNRPMRYISRFGVLILMLSFGASFGFTVMGRISLAIGRARELLGTDGTPERAAQVHPELATLVSVVLIAVVLTALRSRGDADNGGSGQPG